MKFPTERDIRAFLSENPKPLSKRELTDAFGIRGDRRRAFNDLLRTLERRGLIVKEGGAYALPGDLPSVGVIEVIDVGIDGDVFARPADWDERSRGAPPRIEIMPDSKGHQAAPAAGDRVLARLVRRGDDYEAHVIRRLDTPKGRIVGLVARTTQGWSLRPADKKAKYDFDIAPADLGGATDGDMAVCEIQTGSRTDMRNRRARVVDVIGRQTDLGAISLISLHEAGLREEFPKETVDETGNMNVPDLKGREDMRQIPLVTIDGADARDFDDAVFAESAEDGGFHLVVAIADVAHYVRPGSELDREAYRRGNSTYFPDRVVPMLPEKLSNDLCSLRPHENRACMAVHLWIDGGGNLKRHKFVRGLMRSAARLTYEQAQAAKDGIPDSVTKPLMQTVIEPLYAAYAVLLKARAQRGTLEFDLPERKVVLNEKNEMTGIEKRMRLDSHKLIEEFMILANVAAATALEERKAPCVFRVHDNPDAAKLDAVREFVAAFGLSLPKVPVTRPSQLNGILLQASSLPFGHLVSEVMLRAQAQAIYHPENTGHFGLALRRYAHFTSPIRRYADLLVHRSLIRAFGLGEGGLSDAESARLGELSEHISATERLSAEAERNSIDRFAAAFLRGRMGATFNGRIRGVTRAGLFVALEETGADGLVPMRSLPHDFYIHDEHQHALIGRSHRRVYRLGAPVTVILKEADPLTGGALLALTGDSLHGADIPGVTFGPPAGAAAGRRTGRKENRGGKSRSRRRQRKS